VFRRPKSRFFLLKKKQIRTLPFRAGARRLDGFQVFDQVVLLLLGQAQFEDTIVVVNHIEQGGESAVVVEAPFMNLLRIESAQRFCAVTIRNERPSSVRLTSPVALSGSETGPLPNSLICRVSEGCAACSFPAAFVKVSASAMLTK
jgi:hypothetical protein